MAAPPFPPVAAVASARGAGARRIMANLLRLVSGKAGAGLLSLVYLVLAAHRLGVRDYGVLTLVNAYALLIGGVVAFSGFHGVVRYGAQALAAGDRALLGRVVRRVALLEAGCGLVAIAVAMAGVRLVAPHLGWPPAARQLGLVYAFAVLGSVRQTPQAILQLGDRFGLVGLHALIQPSVRMAGAAALWFAGGGLTGFILVWLASAVIEGVSLWLIAWPVWRRLAPGERLFGWPWRVEPVPAGFMRFNLVTNFDLTLRDLAPNLAPLTVGWLLGPAAAGLLAVAQRATNALQQPAMLLAQASYAVLADQVARGAVRDFAHTIRRSGLVALGAGLAAAALLALFAQSLLHLVGGTGFAAARWLIPPLALARAVSLGAVAPTGGLIVLGAPQRSALANIVGNLALYPLLPLLLWRCGVIGAGWHALAQAVAGGGLALALFRDEYRRFARTSARVPVPA